MVPDPSYKILGIFSIALTWLGLLFLIRHWPGDKSMSFSLHAAQTKAGQIYYFILFAVTLPLFYAFVTQWFVPKLNLPVAYVYLTTVAMAGQLVAVLVPAVKGRKEKIHNIGAYLMAFALAPLTALLILSVAPIAVKVLVGIGTLYMLTTIVLSLATPLIKPRYLYFQAAYVAVFHLMILIAAYSVA